MSKDPNRDLLLLQKALDELQFDCPTTTFATDLRKTVTWSVFARFAPIHFVVEFRFNSRIRAVEAHWFIRVRARTFFERNRSDANDIIANTLGLYLRAVLGQSFRFVVEEHVFAKNEIDAVWLIPIQPIGVGSCIGTNAIGDFELKALCIRMFWRVFFPCFFIEGQPQDQNVDCKEMKLLEIWDRRIVKSLGSTTTDRDRFSSCRRNPYWWFFSDDRIHISVIRAARFASIWHSGVARRLQILKGQSGDFITTGDTKNFVYRRDVNVARRVLRELEDSDEPLVVPMENRLAVIGTEHVVFLHRLCGRHVWEKERERLRPRYEAESALLFPPLKFSWRKRIDDAEFERLVQELLHLYPGVESVRSAGPTRQPDAGRDLIVRWMRPDKNGSSNGMGKTQLKKFIVQCKALRRSVSKTDVPDLRDMLEYFNAEGYILVASSKLTGGCISHLEKLAEKFEIDWWTKTELEQQLVRHPELLKRFPKVFRVALSKNPPPIKPR